MSTIWNETQIKRALKILGRTPVSRYREALERISALVGQPVTSDALGSAFIRHKLSSPTSYCIREEAQESDVQQPAAQISPKLDRTKRLYELIKRGPVSLADLCDKLDLSPSKTKTLIEEAQTQGLKIHVEHDHIGIQPSAPDERIQTVGIAPVIGERQQVAVISDTHLGSKYCLREQLKDFIHYAYSKGIREILHPGDVLDGMYRHGLWEVSHSGLDAQAEDLFETLPNLPGLNYRCITGNHDWTFTEANGVDVGQYLQNFFREKGRNDLHFYGNRGAFLKVGGAVFHLWHPKSGAGYARSYAIQKHIEKYSSGEKPAVLLTGHWHVYVHCLERGVHGIACPTFQGGGSAFSKSLGGAPAIGGLLLDWGLTADGTMRDFRLEYRTYYEREKLVSLDAFQTVRG